MLPPPAATITVETTATRFKVSVRHTWGFSTPAGVAIFRATGIARRNLMLRGPTSIYYELHLPSGNPYAIVHPFPFFTARTALSRSRAGD